MDFNLLSKTILFPLYSSENHIKNPFLFNRKIFLETYEYLNCFHEKRTHMRPFCC